MSIKYIIQKNQLIQTQTLQIHRSHRPFHLRESIHKSKAKFKPKLSKHSPRTRVEGFWHSMLPTGHVEPLNNPHHTPSIKFPTLDENCADLASLLKTLFTTIFKFGFKLRICARPCTHVPNLPQLNFLFLFRATLNLLSILPKFSNFASPSALTIAPNTLPVSAQSLLDGQFIVYYRTINCSRLITTFIIHSNCFKLKTTILFIPKMNTILNL